MLLEDGINGIVFAILSLLQVTVLGTSAFLVEYLSCPEVEVSTFPDMS